MYFWFETLVEALVYVKGHLTLACSAGALGGFGLVLKAQNPTAQTSIASLVSRDS